MTKKFIVLFTVFALVLSMTACGNSGKPYDYDLSEYVKLGEYKGIEVEKVEPAAVADEAVQTEITSRLEAAATTETFKEGTVEDGVTVNIDYEGKIDGKAFEGGSAEGFDLIIGSGQFIDGFEDGLIGKKVGDTVTLNLEFPDPYETNPDVAGKAVAFTVTINSLQKSVVPELDEKFVQSVSECKTVKEYEAQVKKELEEQAATAAEQEMITAIWEQVFANAEILKHPEEEVATYEQQMKDYYEQYSKSYGMEMADFLEMSGMTEEEFGEQCKEYAKTSVAEEMVMFSIARAEGIEITDEEYKKGAQKYVDNMGYEDIAALEEEYTKETVEMSLLWEEFFNFLLDNAKIVEAAPDDAKEGVENENK